MAQHESPVDQAIREAAERGAFDNLPGAGRPIPPSTGGDDFLRRWATAEESGQAFLPRSLQLRKEAHDLPQRLAKIRDETKVRHLVDDLNRRIADEVRVSTGGPPLAMRPLEVDQVIEQWRSARTEAAALLAADPAPAEPQGRRRRWWHRRPG